jgi:HAD superfamily hydrolase (TIGR01549 family)
VSAPPLSQFRAVLFDIDGTLLDSMEPLVRGLADACEHFGAFRPTDSQILATLGTPLRVQLTMYGLGEASPSELQARIDWTIARFEHYAPLEKEYEPAVSALKLCYANGWRVALVTSKSKTELDLLLARFRGGEWAHALVCSSDVVHPKPNGECARLACDRLGVRLEETVLIGDSVFDIQCARDAGTASVAVAYGATPEHALVAEQPDASFRSPEDLLEWVNQSALETCHAKKEFTSVTT